MPVSDATKVAQVIASLITLKKHLQKLLQAKYKALKDQLDAAIKQGRQGDNGITIQPYNPRNPKSGGSIT